MMQPSEFMLYATPVILLISQEIRSYLTKRAIQKITEQQTSEINAAGQERVKQLESTTLDTASKLAIHTNAKTNTLAAEIGEIHEIVNGNTTALKNRIAELEAQLAAKTNP